MTRWRRLRYAGSMARSFSDGHCVQAAYVAEVLGAMPNMGQYEVQAVEFR